MDFAFQIESAKSKRDEADDAPVHVPMAPRSAERRNPSTDQKKIRRQLTKKASGRPYTWEEEQVEASAYSGLAERVQTWSASDTGVDASIILFRNKYLWSVYPEGGDDAIESGEGATLADAQSAAEDALGRHTTQMSLFSSKSAYRKRAALDDIVYLRGYRDHSVDVVDGGDGYFYVTEVYADRSGGIRNESQVGDYPSAEEAIAAANAFADANGIAPVVQGTPHQADLRSAITRHAAEVARRVAFMGEEDDAVAPHDGFAVCPACGGVGNLLGQLGQREWYRCRDCGTTFDGGGKTAALAAQRHSR